MKRMSIYLKVIFCLFVCGHAAYSQVASITAGCAELTVEFTAPKANSFYWVFGDGPASVSILQNPVHSYVQAGTYTAQLYDQEGGTQVGDDIIITVYPSIKLEIDADVRNGCAPLEVNFTSTLDIHPDIVVEDIVWTFGDGNSASGQNTNYTYPENGLFTVSVKVITSGSIKCDEPIIFEDYITIDGARARFLIDKFSRCDIPADFTFTNITEAEEGTTYFWDFDNQQTSSEEGPHTITYTSEGLFYPELTTTTPSGCVSTTKKIISIGSPIITPTYPDTICLGAEVLLNHTTIAKDYIWDFTGTSIDTTSIGLISEETRPVVSFNQTGLQTFTLTAIAQDSCETVATLDIFVYQPDASYTLAPDASCSDPLFIEYTANDPNLFLYIFNNNYFGDGIDVTRNTPVGANIYEHPDHDEYHINTQDSITTRLIVSSIQGCRDTVYNNYYIQRPEGFFRTRYCKRLYPF